MLTSHVLRVYPETLQKRETFVITSSIIRRWPLFDDETRRTEDRLPAYFGDYSTGLRMCLRFPFGSW